MGKGYLRRLNLLGFIVAALAWTTPFCYAQQAGNFYQGKMVRLIPYVSPGSAQDVLSRLAARFLEKHIPGEPNIIVQNMPGGGGVIAANYVYKLAKPDGLTVGILPRGMLVLAVAGIEGVEYDPRRFRWLGSPSSDITVCVALSAAGFHDIRDTVGSKKPLIVGSTGRAASSYQVAAALQIALGANIQIIAGYKGAPEMHVAMERGEIQARCLSYFGTEVNFFLKGGLESGKLRYLVQLPERHPKIPRVPVANELVSKPEDRTFLNLVAAPLNPWVVPPETPPDRLAILRRAFMETFHDDSFRSAATKAGFEIDPMPGAEAEKKAIDMITVSEHIRRKLREILGL